MFYYFFTCCFSLTELHSIVLTLSSCCAAHEPLISAHCSLCIYSYSVLHLFGQRTHLWVLLGFLELWSFFLNFFSPSFFLKLTETQLIIEMLRYWHLKLFVSRLKAVTFTPKQTTVFSIPGLGLRGRDAGLAVGPLQLHLHCDGLLVLHTHLLLGPGGKTNTAEEQASS